MGTRYFSPARGLTWGSAGTGFRKTSGVFRVPLQGGGGGGGSYYIKFTDWKHRFRNEEKQVLLHDQEPKAVHCLFYRILQKRNAPPCLARSFGTIDADLTLFHYLTVVLNPLALCPQHRTIFHFRGALPLDARNRDESGALSQ